MSESCYWVSGILAPKKRTLSVLRALTSPLSSKLMVFLEDTFPYPSRYGGARPAFKFVTIPALKLRNIDRCSTQDCCGSQDRSQGRDGMGRKLGEKSDTKTFISLFAFPLPLLDGMSGCDGFDCGGQGGHDGGLSFALLSAILRINGHGLRFRASCFARHRKEFNVILWAILPVSHRIFFMFFKEYLTFCRYCSKAVVQN